jgi:hypothetical protein
MAGHAHVEAEFGRAAAPARPLHGAGEHMRVLRRLVQAQHGRDAGGHTFEQCSPMRQRLRGKDRGRFGAYPCGAGRVGRAMQCGQIGPAEAFAPCSPEPGFERANGDVACVGAGVVAGAKLIDPDDISAQVGQMLRGQWPVVRAAGESGRAHARPQVEPSAGRLTPAPSISRCESGSPAPW